MQHKEELWSDILRIIRGQAKSSNGAFKIPTTLGFALNHIVLGDRKLITQGIQNNSTPRLITPDDLYFIAKRAIDDGELLLVRSLISKVKNGSMICSLLNLHPDFKYLGRPQRLLYLPKALRPDLVR